MKKNALENLSSRQFKSLCVPYHSFEEVSDNSDAEGKRGSVRALKCPLTSRSQAYRWKKQRRMLQCSGKKVATPVARTKGGRTEGYNEESDHCPKISFENWRNTENYIKATEAWYPKPITLEHIDKYSAKSKLLGQENSGRNCPKFDSGGSKTRDAKYDWETIDMNFIKLYPFHERNHDSLVHNDTAKICKLNDTLRLQRKEGENMLNFSTNNDANNQNEKKLDLNAFETVSLSSRRLRLLAKESEWLLSLLASCGYEIQEQDGEKKTLQTGLTGLNCLEDLVFKSTLTEKILSFTGKLKQLSDSELRKFVSITKIGENELNKLGEVHLECRRSTSLKSTTKRPDANNMNNGSHLEVQNETENVAIEEYVDITEENENSCQSNYAGVPSEKSPMETKHSNWKTKNGNKFSTENKADMTTRETGEDREGFLIANDKVRKKKTFDIKTFEVKNSIFTTRESGKQRDISTESEPDSRIKNVFDVMSEFEVLHDLNDVIERLKKIKNSQSNNDSLSTFDTKIGSDGLYKGIEIVLGDTSKRIGTMKSNLTQGYKSFRQIAKGTFKDEQVHMQSQLTSEPKKRDKEKEESDKKPPNESMWKLSDTEMSKPKFVPGEVDQTLRIGLPPEDKVQGKKKDRPKISRKHNGKQTCTMCNEKTCTLIKPIILILNAPLTCLVPLLVIWQTCKPMTRIRIREKNVHVIDLEKLAFCVYTEKMIDNQHWEKGKRSI